jgi:serine/threonine-protein kinase HipA
MDAAGTDAYSFVAVISRDCIGALQFLPDGEELPSNDAITGVPLSSEIKIIYQ